MKQLEESINSYELANPGIHFVVGRAGTGKSLFLLQCAEIIAQTHKVVFIACETQVNYLKEILNVSVVQCSESFFDGSKFLHNHYVELTSFDVVIIDGSLDFKTNLEVMNEWAICFNKSVICIAQAPALTTSGIPTFIAKFIMSINSVIYVTKFDRVCSIRLIHSKVRPGMWFPRAYFVADELYNKFITTPNV